MAYFAYHIIDQNGAERRGKIDAANENVARQRLTDMRYYVVNISVASAQNNNERHHINDKNSAANFFTFRKITKLNHQQLTLFTRQLASLSQVTPLEEAMRTISKQTEKAQVREILEKTHAAVVEGQRLSEAMRRSPQSFPPLYCAMISAGESSGALPEILERLAILMERQAEIRGKLLAALTYPIALTLVAILVVSGLMISVVPRVVEQFDDVDQQLPLITQIVMAISAFLANWWWAIALIILFAAFIFIILLRRDNFRLEVDQFLLRLPLIGKLVRNLNAARMARTLATMVASRLPLLEGLKLTRNIVPNYALRHANDFMIEHVRGGGSLSGAMRQTAVFPPLLVYLTASGESAGQLDVMLARAADYLEREFDNFTSASLALLEPLIIVVMGAIVALIILSILLPILQLQNLAGI
ncbi:type II secretion system protein GspF [Sphingorhabdus lutea]|uniref:General secretion pathway protein F n=1 Tax=Sphingorhabdus lutea TaxID=1913578 RepID=A0A1L3JA37_9SPHN|nr:type II secretion system inner membrane protein GspF [Sphingorhabdus lutea]APG61979.1 type II secretion system protein GspF [Sphingorhabdus lutea]